MIVNFGLNKKTWQNYIHKYRYKQIKDCECFSLGI